tara:strand:- start:558 stop:845 length:288 start_codon:yes stop_codon:yes gene_type:complete
MNSIEAVTSYLKYRNYERLGFLKYCNFKKIISFVLDSKNQYYNRKLFLTLIEKGFIIKKKNIKKSYIYQFNPNPKKDEVIIKPNLDPEKFIIRFN